MLLPLPAMENAADDPNLHNPLKRMERLGTSWFGVIVEFEGVLVEDTSEWHTQAWIHVAQEMGLPRPLGSAMGRTKGVRNEVRATERCSCKFRLLKNYAIAAFHPHLASGSLLRSSSVSGQLTRLVSTGVVSLTEFRH